MGTSKSAGEFAEKITKMALVTKERQKQVVDQGALTGKEIIISQAAARGVSLNSRIAGGKWGVRYDTKGFNNPTSLLRITGPFHLVENDTRPHAIYRRAARVRGRGSRRANRANQLAQAFGGVGAYSGGSLKFNGSVYRKVVDHPGTKGKHIFRDAKKKIGKAVPVVMSQRIVGGWRSALQ